MARSKKVKPHAHRLKLVAFDEDTGVGRWACKCGYEVERTAQFMCEVKGAERWSEERL